MHMMAWSSKALAAVASKAPSVNAIFMAQQPSLPQSSFLGSETARWISVGLAKICRARRMHSLVFILVCEYPY